MPGSQETTLSNRILSSLTPDEYSRLAPHLQHVSLGVRHILRRPSMKMENAYFFTAGMASHVVTMRDGSSMEAGIVGREAMSGLQLALGYDSIPGSYSSMQIAGSAFRIAGTDLREAVNRPGRLRTILTRYAQAQIVQLSQSVACNRLHSTQERFARWLLMVNDRVGSDFAMTHEFLADMLGSQRATVSIEAKVLQRAGIVSYSHGHMKILKRQSLERLACECYKVQLKEFDNFLNC
jgi:CRP-like cAMP-binding protein